MTHDDWPHKYDGKMFYLKEKYSLSYTKAGNLEKVLKVVDLS